jgi:hypothetical protein
VDAFKTFDLFGNLSASRMKVRTSTQSVARGIWRAMAHWVHETSLVVFGKVEGYAIQTSFAAQNRASNAGTRDGHICHSNTIDLLDIYQQPWRSKLSTAMDAVVVCLNIRLRISSTPQSS